MKCSVFHSWWCKSIIDGANQSMFGLPHFVTKSKVEQGSPLKIRWTGLLEHKNAANLPLYTMKEEQETGANRIVEKTHSFISDPASSDQWYPTLYCQADRCTTENKNGHKFCVYCVCRPLDIIPRYRYIVLANWAYSRRYRLGIQLYLRSALQQWFNYAISSPYAVRADVWWSSERC